MRWVVVATWDSAPHLTKEMKEAFLQAIPPHQRKARSEGIPHLGSGLVFPIPEESIKIPDFPLSMHWKRCYAFDTGWNWNAAVHMAWDEQQDVVYIYHCYKREAAEPPINAAAIKSQGAWIPGVADAADTNRLDGKQWIDLYRDLGLDLELPDKAVETGITELWTRLSTGRLRVFESCSEWFEEYRTYSRNEKGILPKQNDHLIDASRYGVLSGLRRAKTPPSKERKMYDVYATRGSWMG